MRIYVILYTEKIDLDKMIYVGCSLTSEGALDIVKKKFKKFHKDQNVIKDTDTDQYFIHSKYPYGIGNHLICIRKEEVK